MKYTLLLGRPAETELNRLPDLIQARLSKRILSLENDPRPQGCKKLLGRAAGRGKLGAVLDLGAGV